MAGPGPLVGWPTWVGLVCEDLDHQREFYRDVLGLSELEAGRDWVWFDMGWPRLFELLAVDRSRPQYDERRFQVAFSTADIHAARQELLRRGVEPVTEIEGGPESHEYWCYFRDPEGFLFEIVQPLGLPWRSSGTGTRQVLGWPVFVGVVVEDLSREQAFFRNLLEFPQLREGDGWVEFDLGWPNLLAVKLRDEPHDRTGYYVSFAAGDIRAARTELMGRGVQPVGEIAEGPEAGGYWCHYRDPEGNVFATSQRLGPPWP